MKTIRAHEVPNFSDVIDFTVWYFRSGMPVLLPKVHEVFVSDDATASCLFRHGRFQFEMYLIHPRPVIPQHEHPGVSNIEIPSERWDDLDINLLRGCMQHAGQSHGGSIRERAQHSGFLLFSAQMWDEGLEVSTIGARWKGHTAGPKHEALIKRFNPDCLMYPGYADVTKQAEVADVL
jgi:hypothetical protein